MGFLYFHFLHILMARRKNLLIIGLRSQIVRGVFFGFEYGVQTNLYQLMANPGNYVIYKRLTCPPIIRMCPIVDLTRLLVSVPGINFSGYYGSGRKFKSLHFRDIGNSVYWFRKLPHNYC